MKPNSKITLTIGQLQKLVNETVFDQKELRALANESQWMSIEEYVKKNDLDLDEFLGRASTNGEPMSPDAKLPIDELDHYASYCEKSSKGYKQSKIFVFGIQWDTHDETTNPLPNRAKLTVPTPNGKADKRAIHEYLYSIYKVEPLDFDWEDLTNDLPHGMFAPSWGEQVKEAKKVKTEPMLNENTKFILTIGQLKRLVKESGMTIEDAFDQMEQDVRKAKYAYLKGEVEEASNTVFEIIKDAKNVSNRLTETTGGPLMESNGKPNVKRVACDATANVIDEAVQLAMEFARVMENVPDGLYDTIQPTDVENEKTCLSVVMGMRDAAKACQHTFGTGSQVQGLDDFVTSAQLFIDHWQKELEPYLDVPFESKQHNKRKQPC